MRVARHGHLEGQMLHPLRAYRSWPRGIRRSLFAIAFLALWGSILHYWLRGPWGSAVPNARPWDWPVSTAEAEGLDPDKLATLTQLIRTGECCPQIQALLIARHGRLVTEEYFHGWAPDLLHTLQSVTKSFTSALVGIAISRGEFKGLDERVVDFFPGSNELIASDSRKASLRLRDLLTMRTGVDYHEHGVFSPHAMLNLLQWGQDTWYLRRPMLASPGTVFQYDSGGAVLLSGMLKRRSKMHAEDYAVRYLFAPLGIRRQSWRSNLTGHTHTGGGLHLTARDTAKLGQLYLQNGRWNGAQVVPEAWVRESLQRHVAFDAHSRGVIGYGYLWWVLSDGVYAAIGRWGQSLFVVPEHDLVVTVFSRMWPGTDHNQPLELLYEHILPAVSRNTRR
jgi:CubicO group peptidase (beta-lactamase class C family)